MLTKIVSVPGLVIALLLSAPALLTAWDSSSVDLVPVMLTFIVTAVAASFGVNGLQALINGYRRSAMARAHLKQQQAQLDRIQIERERRMNASS